MFIVALMIRAVAFSLYHSTIECRSVRRRCCSIVVCRRGCIVEVVTCPFIYLFVSMQHATVRIIWNGIVTNGGVSPIGAVVLCRALCVLGHNSFV